MNPLCIDGQCIKTVDSFKLLGNTISDDLSWKANSNAIVSKAHQRLYFLKQPKKFGLKKKMLTGFYRCTIESGLSFSKCIILFQVYYSFPFVCGSAACQLTDNVI